MRKMKKKVEMRLMAGEKMKNRKMEYVMGVIFAQSTKNGIMQENG